MTNEEKKYGILIAVIVIAVVLGVALMISVANEPKQSDEPDESISIPKTGVLEVTIWNDDWFKKFVDIYIDGTLMINDGKISALNYHCWKFDCNCDNTESVTKTVRITYGDLSQSKSISVPADGIAYLSFDI